MRLNDPRLIVIAKLEYSSFVDSLADLISHSRTIKSDLHKCNCKIRIKQGFPLKDAVYGLLGGIKKPRWKDLHLFDYFHSARSAIFNI